MKTVSPRIIQSVRRITLRSRLSALAATGVLVACTTVVPTANQIVAAQNYQEQINAIQADSANKRATVNNLLDQAASFQDVISKLQAQIDGLQASINANVALQSDLQRQIQEAQTEIDRQRGILASDVKAMYVDGTPDTVVLMATSKNLSEFVDKQEYRSRVQGKLQLTMKKIAALQKQLQVQKAKVETLLKEQQSQQARLDGDRAEQQRLLNLNDAERTSINSQITSNNARVSELQAAQAAANRRLSSNTGGVIAGDPGRGGYPSKYADIPKDAVVDAWGMYNRECVSYTAWKVYQTFGYMPYWGGVGNANQWPGNAVRAGIPTGSTPRVNSVAVWNVGYYGHVMWVEAVNPDGSIWISQYNYDFNGHYSEMKISAAMASSLTYIYFR
ncbi:MAG: Peptidase protein [Patescibacteria group bacterium]|nr:CHAP domain-containing protein [Candidatus Saccharibacteria bacterium]MDQ5963604.1 Peptidase protein [Patescibacteria group bacterium]